MKVSALAGGSIDDVGAGGHGNHASAGVVDSIAMSTLCSQSIPWYPVMGSGTSIVKKSRPCTRV